MLILDGLRLALLRVLCKVVFIGLRLLGLLVLLGNVGRLVRECTLRVCRTSSMLGLLLLLLNRTSIVEW